MCFHGLLGEGLWWLLTPAQGSALSLSHPPAVTVFSPEDEQKGEKIYLYTHLKQQPIW